MEYHIKGKYTMWSSRLNKLLLIFILLFSFCISIGYSALNASLSVTGDLVYRVPADIRITGVKISSVTNGGLEQYSPKYTKDTVSFGLKLPNLDSTVTYEVTITNKSSKKKRISSITSKFTGNTSISYTFDYKKTAIAANTSIKILFTYKYNSGITSVPSNTIEENTILLTFEDVMYPLYDKIQELSRDSSNNIQKYTGDTSTFTGNETVYYYYGDSPNNNILFGGFCWRMYRTTDTGGVKLVYNGEPDSEGSCGASRGTHAGYDAFGTVQSLSTNYMYGTDYTYDASSKTFTISGTTEEAEWSDSTYSELIGKYTCRNTTGSCDTLYHVKSYYSSSQADTLPINSTTAYSQIGKSAFNNNASPADVGYMYNKRYTTNSMTMSSSTTVLTNSSLSTSYYYADSIKFGVTSSNAYSLVNPYRVTDSTKYSDLVGKYTFRRNTVYYTDTSVYYIAGVSGSTMYYIQLSSGQELADVDTAYAFADSITEDESGKNILAPETTKTVKRSEWFTSYADYKNKYYQDTSGNIYYVTATTSKDFNYVDMTNDYMYGNSFTYDKKEGEYTLSGETQHFWNWFDNYSKLGNTHYTCWNTSGKCKKIAYIYYVSSKPYYIELENNTSVEEALEEMLHDEDVNMINSTIKTVIDAWYSKNMIQYTDYFEDTVWCNSRRISDLGSWSPNSGKLTNYLYYWPYSNSSNLTCPDKIDSFTVESENGNGALTYPVGLVTRAEQNLAYSSSNSPLSSGNDNSSLSPISFYNIGATRYLVNSSGNYYENSVNLISGVRPSVSLRSGIEYNDGDGSEDNPYIINMNS